MSGNKAPLIYWDTNVFLAYCKNENHHGDETLPAIIDIVHKIESNKLQLATSTLAIAELVKGNPTDEQTELFKNVFNRPNIHFIDTNRYIAELAGEIFKGIGTKSGTKLSVPDCIHLASAAYYKCAIFYTLDGENGKIDGILTNAQILQEGYNIKVGKPSILGTLPLQFIDESK